MLGGARGTPEGRKSTAAELRDRGRRRRPWRRLAGAPAPGTVEEVEGAAAVPFLAPVWLGEDRGVVFVKLRERHPWRSVVGRTERGRGRRGDGENRGLGFGAGRRSSL